ncbi:hypothetical protein B0H19DRAFT_1230084 [Mycena capillaripes]|nr:hypothetical protein B0H19DRAFT_1230084 [Mycena capillaripes]
MLTVASTSFSQWGRLLSTSRTYAMSLMSLGFTIWCGKLLEAEPTLQRSTVSHTKLRPHRGSFALIHSLLTKRCDQNPESPVP